MNKTILRTDWTSRFNMLIFSASAIILPVSLVSVKEELGLSLTQAGALGFFPSLLQFLVLLTSSLYASRIAKIPALKVASFLTGVGLIIFSRAFSFSSALVILLLINGSTAIMEGLLTPLVEDLHPEDTGKKMNQLHAFWPGGTLITVLLVGELLSRGISWRPQFILLGGLFISLVLLYPRNKEVPFHPSGADLGHLKQILKHPAFWFLGMALFFAGGAEGTFAFWTASYIQLEWGALPRSGAIGVASFALGMLIGRMTAARVADKRGLKWVLYGAASLSLGVSFLFMTITSLPLLFLFMLVMGFAIGPLWPSIQSYAARRIPIDPTTMMILLSCFGVPGYSTATFAMGIIGDIGGLRLSFLIAPLYLALMVISFRMVSMHLKGVKKGRTQWLLQKRETPERSGP